MSLEEKKRIIEALLFAGGDPLTVKQIRDIFDGDVDANEIRSLIAELREEYGRGGRSFQIAGIAGGFQMTTRPEYASWIKKLFTSGQSNRLSHPGLETLAIIAYRQPVTRQEIESIRGVNVDGVVAGLLDKELIRIVGRKETVGRPIMYGTTTEFLEYFGLHSLDELPAIEEFADSGAADADVIEETGGLTENGETENSKKDDKGERLPEEIGAGERTVKGVETGEVNIDEQSQEVT